jgi:hypothetical protein
MALKRVLWVAIPAFAMVVGAIVILPPRPMESDSDEWFWSEHGWYRTGRVHREAIQSAVRGLRNRVDAVAAVRVLERSMRESGALRTPDGLITLITDRRLGGDSAQLWLTWLTNELATVPPVANNPSPVPIVVALLTDSTRWVPVDGRGPTWMVRRQVGGVGPGQRCYVEVRLKDTAGFGGGRPVHARTNGTRRSNVLDWCALYARFGRPGPEVGAWARVITRMDFGPYDYEWEGIAAAITAARAPQSPRPLDGDFYLVASCASGRTGVCRSSLGLDRPAGLDGTRNNWWSNLGPNQPTRLGFLASLLADESPQRFAALWSSQRPVGAALREAYGMEPEALVSRWASRRFVPARQRPGDAGAGQRLLASFGWSALLLALAAAAASRQQAT